MYKKLKGILSFLLAMSMILSQSLISEASEKKSSIFVQELKVDHTNYFGTFTIPKNSVKKINISVSPKNADKQELKWKSSNKAVVSVSKSGVMKGIKEGKANITVSATDGSKVKQTIKVVVGTPVKSIVANSNKLTLTEGSKSKLTFTVKPGNATDKTLAYRSSDNKIATVSETGEVKAVAAGTATITAVAKDGSSKKTVVSVTVKELKVNQTLTDKDVVNGKIIVSDKIVKNLRIDKSVGSASITLDHVTVVGNLEMENDAKYTIFAKNSDINKVVALEENADEIRSFAIGDAAGTEPIEAKTVDTPTFVAEEGTLVVSVDARGNISVKQGAASLIGTVSVTRKIDGDIELKLEGFNGNLVVTTESNANIAITTTSCNIPEATISGKSTGQRLTLTDNTAKGEKSTVGKINVETNAKFKLDIPAKELVIAETVEAANVTIEKPIEKIINEGKATELAVNNNVNNIVSTGEKLEMKVAAGSQVASVESQGASSKIEVALGSTISNVISYGTASEISGSGTIKEVKVEGNNTVINSRSAKVIVAAEVTGTTSNGVPVSGGTIVTTPIPTQVPSVIQNPIPYPPQPPVSTPTATPSPKPTVTPTPGITPPETGTVITISDPGKIIAGNEVQLEADLDQVVWSVYSYMDGTSGFAVIDQVTGLLQPRRSGVVRVVVRSALNPEVYGAVDLTIYDKRFVGYEPLDVVEINSNQNLSDDIALMNSGLMPTELNCIYETGNGTETETITAEIYRWYSNDFSGGVANTYMVSCDALIPSGYEYPMGFETHAFVQVKTPQTDIRKIITGVRNSPEPIVISSDKHLVDFSTVYDEYFSEQEIAMVCQDGSEVNVGITGWYDDMQGEFNGTVPGTYYANLWLKLPVGYKYREYHRFDESIDWRDLTSMKVRVQIVVQTAQTPMEYPEPEIPDATQPDFSEVTEVAEIEAVGIHGGLWGIYTMEVIDFSQYLTVYTDSELQSDHRVYWTVDGDNSPYLDYITGIGMFTEAAQYTITATSVVDSSKKDSITIFVNNSKLITEYLPINSITITKDLHIVNFRSLYKNIEDQLPTVLIAKDNLGATLQIPIHGWRYDGTLSNRITLIPLFDIPNGYNGQGLPAITIYLGVPQTDNRIKIKEAALITSDYQLSEDNYAVTEKRLFEEVFNEGYNSVVRISAVLEDDSTEVLECYVRDFMIKRQDIPEGYYGQTGTVPVLLRLSCPEGYTVTNPYDYISDLGFDINIQVDVEQTPRYQEVWVNRKPRLEYEAGETIDLSQLIVRIRDTSVSGEVTDEFIGYDNLGRHNIILYMDDPSNRITAETVMTKAMDGKFIQVESRENSSFTSFGPLHIAGDNVITGFVEEQISNGAVIGGLYHDTLEELMEYALPKEVHTLGDNSITVPVREWINTDNYPELPTLPEPGVYIFTAVLDTNALPDRYILGDGVTATVMVVIYQRLYIEKIYPAEMYCPLDEFGEPSLPKITVELSDGVMSYSYLDVEWDRTNGYDPYKEGTYHLTGTIRSEYVNYKNLVPSLTVTIDLKDDATMEFIEITNLPNNLIYNIGEAFDPEGLSAALGYSDGSLIRVVTGSAITGFNSLDEGIQDLRIEYYGTSTTFKVYVKPASEQNSILLLVKNPNNLEVISLDSEGNLPELPAPVRPGYYFVGWFWDQHDTPYRAGEPLITEDREVYARWVKLR